MSKKLIAFKQLIEEKHNEELKRYNETTEGIHNNCFRKVYAWKAINQINAIVEAFREVSRDKKKNIDLFRFSDTFIDFWKNEVYKMAMEESKNAH